VAEQELISKVVKANGLDFDVVTCGEGGDLALLLHGFPETNFSWRAQLPFLAGQGYKVWAPNMRGYGKTSRPTGVRNYAIELLMEDVAGLIDAARAKTVTLVGHDWGALIAWTFAVRELRTLERLVIMNVPHPGIVQRKLFTWPQIARSWYIFFFQLPYLPELGLTFKQGRMIEKSFVGTAVDKSKFPKEVTDFFRENALLPGAATAMVNYYRGLFRGGSAWRQYRLGWPRIKTPTLLIWGEQDAFLEKSLTGGTGEFVEDLTIHFLPHVSHWVQQEAPDEVNGIMAHWLSNSR
jgi:pimeloyl-ACP methyl ester carboxylesterase